MLWCTPFHSCFSQRCISQIVVVCLYLLFLFERPISCAEYIWCEYQCCCIYRVSKNSRFYFCEKQNGTSTFLYECQRLHCLRFTVHSILHLHVISNHSPVYRAISVWFVDLFLSTEAFLLSEIASILRLFVSV